MPLAPLSRMYPTDSRERLRRAADLAEAPSG
jgi:hypothetical protein